VSKYEQETRKSTKLEQPMPEQEKPSTPE
jgi:hypothetical protein